MLRQFEGDKFRKDTKKVKNLEKKPILETKGIKKNFGGIEALRNVELSLYPNEVLALLGDNGAGKSTLIKIICGVHQADGGQIFLEGKPVDISNPQVAMDLGIKTIYQDLALFGDFDIPSNLFIGKEIRKGRIFLNNKEMERRSDEILKKLKISIKSLHQKVEVLSGGQQHAVAIGRTCYVGSAPKIILMDEPTAGLGVKESNELFNIVKELKNKGISVVLVSHNLQHVFLAADRAVVLRSGVVAGEKMIAETNTVELIQLMVG